MTSLAQVQIPPPSDWPAFERASTVLWSCVLGDRLLKRFGRNGQEQFGLDITGYQNGEAGKLVGIQCKCITQPKKLTSKAIRQEVTKAAAYLPPC